MQKFIYNFALAVIFIASAIADNVGQWDSGIYNLIEHPKTVAIRIEVVDSETRMPIENAEITFKGNYNLEGRNSRHPEGAREAQIKAYELSCKTDNRGIAIGAFGWQKDYPWQEGVDEIEKVQVIEARHPEYNYAEISAPFQSFLNVGQESNSSGQEPDVFDRFEKAWQAQCSLPDTIFCVLNLGTGFTDFGNKYSDRSEFFEKIYAKDWGVRYQQPRNSFSKGQSPQSLCGPYFVCMMEIRMEKIRHYSQTLLSPPPQDMEYVYIQAVQFGDKTIASKQDEQSDTLLVQGMEYFDKQLYTKAFDCFKKCSESGNTNAMNNIGFMYDQGLGVIYDTEEAMKWYFKAAEAGCPSAMVNLALMYSEGDEKDNVKTVQWFEKAGSTVNPSEIKKETLTRSITELNLSGSNIANINAIYMINGLKKLCLSECKQITNINSLYFLNALEELDLSYCGEIKDFRALSGMKNLKVLHLQGTNINTTKPLAFLKNIKTLNVANTKLPNADFIKNMAQIEDLDVSGLEVNIELMAELKMLKYLRVENAFLNNWEYFRRFNLKYLDMTDAILDTTIGIDYVLENMKELEYMEIERLKRKVIESDGTYFVECIADANDPTYWIGCLKSLKNNIPQCKIHTDVTDQAFYDYLRHPIK